MSDARMLPFVLADTVEMLTAAEEGWDQVAPGTSHEQMLGDTYGNTVRITQVATRMWITFQHVTIDGAEEIFLDARLGATRIARTIMLLAEAPAEDADY